MQKSSMAIVGLCLLLGAAPIYAQGAPQPGPEHQRLAFWEGQWTFEGEMAETPMGPGGKVSSKDRCEWFEGGFAIVCHTEGQNPMGPVKGLSISTYDPGAKTYTYYGIDSSGFPAFAKGSVDGKTWTYHSESTMGEQKVRTCVTLVETSANSYSFKFEMATGDGPLTTFIEGKGTKSGS